MLRKLLTTICTIEVLSPNVLIRNAERLALENPEDCDVRSWVAPVARLEGVVFLILMWRSDASYSTFKKFLGVIGLLALLYPRAYVDYGTKMAYTSASTPEWRPWVYTGTRVIGVLYLLVALTEILSRSTSESVESALDG